MFKEARVLTKHYLSCLIIIKFMPKVACRTSKLPMIERTTQLVHGLHPLLQDTGLTGFINKTFGLSKFDKKISL